MKTTVREYTASEITDYALKVLKLLGYCAWRNNNLAVRGRKFIGKKGAGDLTGYKIFDGRRMEAEIKTINDKLSQDQIEFLNEAKANGVHVYLATQKGNEIIVDRF
jgi:hypothetical protein